MDAIRKLCLAIMGLLITIGVLCGCSTEKGLLEQGLDQWVEAGDWDDQDAGCRYSFDNGCLVLRTKNYDDVIRADTVPEEEREEYGFWSAQNTDSYIQYGDMVFRVEGSSTYEVARYDASGRREVLFMADGIIDLITCENDALYVLFMDLETDRWGIYRINDCVSTDHTVDCLADIESSIEINYGFQSIVKYDEWIYFLYFDDSKHYGTMDPQFIWLYRLSEETGVIERVESAYDVTSIDCRELTEISEQDGKILIEGIEAEKTEHAKMYYLFLYDPSENTCVLLCDQGCGGSQRLIRDGIFYHIHQDPDGSTYWAVRDIMEGTGCQMVGDLIEAGVKIYDNDYLARLYVEEDALICATFGGNGYDSYRAYCIDLSENGAMIQIDSTQYMPDVFYDDGIIYMFVNGAVVYARADDPDVWNDSGIRHVKRAEQYTEASDKTLFVEKNGRVYFVTYDFWSYLEDANSEEGVVKELEQYYSSTYIPTDFSNQLSPDTTIFHPNASLIEPTYMNGAQPPFMEMRDSWGNTLGWIGQRCAVFDPHNCPGASVQYDTGGGYRYMSGAVSVTSLGTVASGKLVFYADGDFIYETPVMNKDSAPVEFMIDVGYADTVTVEAVSVETEDTGFVVDGVQLIMDCVSFHDHDMVPYAMHWKGE